MSLSRGREVSAIFEIFSDDELIRQRIDQKTTVKLYTPVDDDGTFLLVRLKSSDLSENHEDSVDRSQRLDYSYYNKMIVVSDSL